jgi:hypothetical protein
VLLAVALGPTPTASVFLLSISQTSDATGPWWNYKLDATKDGSTPTNNWADYPSLGVDSQALYLTANMFKVNGPFAYAKLRIVPKAGPYAGCTLGYKDFVKLQNADGSLAFSVQPCHTFGAPNVESLVNSVYSTRASPRTMYAGARYTGRRASNPFGQLQPSAPPMHEGGGAGPLTLFGRGRRMPAHVALKKPSSSRSRPGPP